MYYTMCLLVLTAVFIGFYIVSHRRSQTSRLPPGPYRFPIIGSVFKLGSMPHHSLAKLSKTYGPFMSLKLGSTTAIVISSPKLAKDFLQKHDLTFSGRLEPDASHAHDHHNKSVLWLPVASKWRNLRKIYKERIGSQKLDASQSQRRNAVERLCEHAYTCSLRDEAVDIGRAAFTTTLNVLSNFFFSIDMGSYHSNSSQEFKDMMWAVMEILGRPNLADYFPVLKAVDPQGVRRQSKLAFGKLLGIFDRIIVQRLQERSSSTDTSLTRNDALDSLLNISSKDDQEWSLSDIKHLLLDFFVAGTDTTSSTVEWAMSELLHNPEKMAKARSELLEVIGKDGVVQESDTSRLPYLQAILKETLRLHPPAPFLAPHKAEDEVEVEGFMVPKDAQILVNVWAIGRDSSIWEKPEAFMPERFLDCDTDFKGQHFELIPFGSGRRICPGMGLAHKMVHLMLGSLLYSFEWKLDQDMKTEDLNMSEKFGLTLQKAVPLRAIPIKNHHITK